MREEKFTPGPWEVGWEKNPLLFPFIWQENGFAIAKMCGKPIERLADTADPVSCLADFADPENVLADAALIAAAPDMYEFGETTAEVMQILLERLGPKPAGLDAEIKRLAEERISEWMQIGKKARAEMLRNTMFARRARRGSMSRLAGTKIELLQKMQQLEEAEK